MWRAGKWLLLLALLIGFFWFEQNSIQTEVIDVRGAPSAFDGQRIAVISDLHGKEFGEGNQVLLEKTASLKPNLIVITGDLVREEEEFKVVPALASGLTKIAPTYYVTGNHEWAGKHVPELKELLASCGVKVLSNEFVSFEQNGQTLVLLGADDRNGHADQKTVPKLADDARAAEGEDAFLLLLSHRNNRVETYEEAKVDLTLCGHAHGGQIRLPFTDGLIGPHREFLPKYTAGLYKLSYGQMVVSRGLGGELPAFRLFNRPHLPLVILRAGT
ncbi:MAG: putative hydrolase [Evtepia sp.]|nr:putative hydrolase [Evtepia sp.]